MAWTAVPLIAGVTVSGRYSAFVTTAITSADGSAMVGGDWTVDGSGIITLNRAVLLGSICFTLHDDSGTIAAAPGYPAINARLTANIADTPTPGNGLNVGTRLNSLLTHYQTTSSVTYTEGIYAGTDFDIVAYCDGSLGNSPDNVHLLLELDITLAPPGGNKWTDKLRCTEVT